MKAHPRRRAAGCDRRRRQMASRCSRSHRRASRRPKLLRKNRNPTHCTCLRWSETRCEITCSWGCCRNRRPLRPTKCAAGRRWRLRDPDDISASGKTTACLALQRSMGTCLVDDLVQWKLHDSFRPSVLQLGYQLPNEVFIDDRVDGVPAFGLQL